HVVHEQQRLSAVDYIQQWYGGTVGCGAGVSKQYAFHVIYAAAGNRGYRLGRSQAAESLHAPGEPRHRATTHYGYSAERFISLEPGRAPVRCQRYQCRTSGPADYLYDSGPVGQFRWNLHDTDVSHARRPPVSPHQPG